MNNKALRVLTLLALITLSTTLMAQKQFTLEDLNFGGTNYKNMTPGDRTLLWWGDRLVHVEASACYTVNPSNGKESTLLTAADLNRSIEAAGGDETATLQGAVSFPYPDQPLAL